MMMVSDSSLSVKKNNDIGLISLGGKLAEVKARVAIFIFFFLSVDVGQLFFRSDSAIVFLEEWYTDVSFLSSSYSFLLDFGFLLYTHYFLLFWLLGFVILFGLFSALLIVRTEKKDK